MHALLPQRRFHSYYVVVGLATAAIMALSGFLVWKQRAEGYAMAEVSVANTADVLAIQVDNSLDQANALLDSVGRRYLTAQQRGALEVEHLVQQVRSEVPNYPLISRVGITNELGISSINTGYGSAPVQYLNLSDRDYFQRARAGDKGLIYSGPLMARLTGEWSLVLARRIESPSGVFMGVVYATLPVQTIGKSFAQLGLGPGGVVNLRTADLAQVARYPELSGAERDVGNRSVSSAIRELMRAQPGQDRYVFEAVAPTDGIERIYAYRKFDHAPFWMTVGRASADLETAWRRTAFWLAVLALGISSFLVWGAGRLATQHLALDRRLKEKEDAERRLRDSEERLNTILDNVEAYIYLKDTEGRYVYANAAVRRLWQVSMEQIVGRTDAQFFDAQTAATVRSTDRRVIEEGATVRTEESTTVLATAQPATYFSVKLPLRDAAGRIYALCGISTDLTEQRLATSALRRTLASLDDAQRVGGVGSYELDFASGLWSSSPELERILGIHADFARNVESWLSLVHAEDRGMMTEYLQQEVMGAGKPFEKEYRIVRHNDGVTRWVYGRGQLDRDASGQLLRMVGTIMDITERRQVAQELAASQARFRTILDNAADAIFVCDPQGRYQYVNQQACRLLGYASEAMLQMAIADITPADDAEHSASTFV
ncbi:MAG: PAS domain S-box protein, partial [Rhodoferax sp.]|nr:PAS domain S-box protein [Rhodoferax sp.]